MTSTDARPTYLTGHLAPVPDELTARDLPVTGTLPAELSGRYFRNGPNPLPGEDPGHWFTGHGMLHGVRIADGRAEWYRNRWVRTARLAGHPHLREDGSTDLTAVNANTHVIEHAGRLLALVENGFPHEVTPELDTIGPCDFGGRLTTAMAAHPKQDPVTGELFFFGTAAQPPYVTYHRLDAAGELVHSEAIEVPARTMMHDFAITEHHVVWLDLPVTWDKDLRGMPFRWNDGYGARLGVMARTGGAVRWFDIEPCYVFHVGNAREDADGRIVLDGTRYTPEAFGQTWSRTLGKPKASTEHAHLHRWTLDPVTGAVHEEQLDDRNVEFPTISDTLVGRDNRYLYSVGGHTVVKYDLLDGVGTEHRLGENSFTGEAVFVPARGASAEDDGWLLTIVTDPVADTAELRVLDAADVAAAPVASVHLPRRVPAGFHGSWIPDEEH